MDTRQPVILLIEDDAQIRRFLQISFQANQYSVLEARDGAQGLEMAASLQPNLVILDLGLPDMDGQSVILRLREWSQAPVLVLSVRGEEREKVRALDAGANDYLTKPVGINELMARVRVMLRSQTSIDSGEAVFDRDGLIVDLARRIVRLHGRQVSLSRKEYQVLSLLVRNAGRVVTHQQMLRHVWGPTSTEEIHYLRIIISALRQKLADDPTDPHYIITEQGVGYRLIE